MNQPPEVKWWNAFATRMVALVGLAALLGGALVGAAALDRAQRSMRESVLTDNLAAADAVAGFSSNSIYSVEIAVQRLASRAQVVDGIAQLNTGELDAELDEFDGDFTVVDSVTVANREGVVVGVSLRAAAALGSSVAATEGFQRALATSLPYLGIPTRSDITGLPTVTYTVPIMRQDGVSLGVVRAGISLRALSDVIARIRPEPDVRAAVIDHRSRGGIILIHTDPALVLTEVADGNAAVSRLLAGDRGVMEVQGSRGEQDLVAFTQVPGLPWGVYIQQPSSEAFADLQRLSRDVALLIAGLTLLAAAAAIWLALRFTRPVARLRATVARFSAGDATARCRLRQADEIGLLGSAFDDMADQLTARDDKLQALLAELEDKVAERTSELTEANQALSQEKATLDAVLSSMTDGLLVVDAPDTIRFANEQAASMAGLPLEELTGATVTGVVQRLGARLVNPAGTLRAWERAVRQPKQSGLFEASLVDGGRRDFEVRVFELRMGKGQGRSLAVVIRDVTAERDLARTKNQLLATVSHELRTPLASLVGFTELLLERRLSEANRRLYLTTMRRDGERLTELINNFLDLQHMESGAFNVQPAKVDIHGVVSPRVLLAGDNATHEVVFDVPDEPILVWADEEALRVVLEHFLSNARKFSPPGSQIRVAVRTMGEEVEVSVADTGAGIAPNTLPKLFDKFSRADNSNERTTQGAGLGLAICRHLVEALGGRIWAESAGVGQGSRFVFTLRLADSPAGVPLATGTHQP